jgi:hypothetical protein
MSEVPVAAAMAGVPVKAGDASGAQVVQAARMSDDAAGAIFVAVVNFAIFPATGEPELVTVPLPAPIAVTVNIPPANVQDILVPSQRIVVVPPATCPSVVVEF